MAKSKVISKVTKQHGKLDKRTSEGRAANGKSTSNKATGKKIMKGK